MTAFDKGRSCRLGVAALFAAGLLVLPATAQETAPEEAMPAAAMPQEPMAAAASEAAAEAAAEAPAPPDCTGEEYQRFNFWVGDWQVYPWSGREVETPPESTIERILDGCAIRESFSSPGYAGTSLTFYDRYDERWHQTWIASDGDPLYLVGDWQDGKLVLADQPTDGRPQSRITWEPLGEGGVRQTWELSKDGGATWQVVFDGRYQAKSGG
jgi:hypothetical protein